MQPVYHVGTLRLESEVETGLGSEFCLPSQGQLCKPQPPSGPQFPYLYNRVIEPPR